MKERKDMQDFLLLFLVLFYFILFLLKVDMQNNAIKKYDSHHNFIPFSNKYERLV